MDGVVGGGSQTAVGAPRRACRASARQGGPSGNSVVRQASGRGDKLVCWPAVSRYRDFGGRWSEWSRKTSKSERTPFGPVGAAADLCPSHSAGLRPLQRHVP